MNRGWTAEAPHKQRRSGCGPFKAEHGARLARGPPRHGQVNTLGGVRQSGAKVVTPPRCEQPLSNLLRERFGSDLGVIWEGCGPLLARVWMLDVPARHGSLAELPAEDSSRPGLWSAP